LLRGMMSAVEFDRKTGIEAAEVDDKPGDRHLTTELQSGQTAIT
jgi:hypothetical protein